MAAKVKTWVWVVAGVVILGVLGLVAVVALSVYFFSRNIETREVSPTAAAREFDEVRARFEGQKALIELDSRGRLLRTNPDRPAPEQPRAPDQLSVLAFDPKDGRIVRVSVPFWLLRLKTGGATIDFNGGRMDLEDLKLTVEDLQRFGPTLIVDHTTPSGERVLVWSQ
jgi:hypothetical protein